MLEVPRKIKNRKPCEVRRNEEKKCRKNVFKNSDLIIVTLFLVPIFHSSSDFMLKKIFGIKFEIKNVDLLWFFFGTFIG